MFEIETGGVLVLISLLYMTAGCLFAYRYVLRHSGIVCNQELSRQHGFTLLELMVVLAILGVMLAIASGSWSNVRAGDQVRSVAEKLRSSMVASRIKALSSGQRQYVGIDLSSETFATTIDDTLAFNASTSKWGANTNWIETQGVNLLDSNADGSAATPSVTMKNYEFDPRGVTNKTGESCVLVKANDGAVTLGRVVIVNNFTGKVRVDDCTFPGMKCQ